MTETISHWADGKRQDGYSDRIRPVFGPPAGKEKVRVAFASVQGGGHLRLGGRGREALGRILSAVCPR